MPFTETATSAWPADFARPCAAGPFLRHWETSATLAVAPRGRRCQAGAAATREEGGTMSWKSWGRTLAAALAACTLAAASPAAAQPTRSGRQSGGQSSFLDQLTAALKHHLSVIWPGFGEKAGTGSPTGTPPGGAPSTDSSTPDPPCNGCTEQGPLIDPHG